jgi:hypothetical protein
LDAVSVKDDRKTLIRRRWIGPDLHFVSGLKDVASWHHLDPDLDGMLPAILKDLPLLRQLATNAKHSVSSGTRLEQRPNVRKGAKMVVASSEPISLLLRSKSPDSSSVGVPEPSFELPAFLFCFTVTSLGTLTEPVAVTGHVILIEAAQRQMLGGAQVAQLICTSV